MARIPMAAFGEGAEVVRVYLAQGLGEAQSVEDALEAMAARFSVEVEEIPVTSLLGGVSVRRAVGFWVAEADVETTVAALERGGHVKGLVDLGTR
jgi:hypothetical protein